MITPTDLQIKNAQLMGWTYSGDCLFERGDFIGYFTEEGWVKE